ncbi:hypothetical protein OG21DRAFT_204815 [Imleria badia]|nr:hypothetical protein OG21DRAFT_204815 [Imleria badia]
MTFVSFVLPPVIGYFVVAVLAVTPQTYTLRLALWPAVTLFALRAAVSVDTGLGAPFFVSSMIFIVTRTLDWTLSKEPLARHLRPTKGSQSTIMDALDLATTFRGHGWDWARGVYIPRETRPTHRRGFAFHIILSTGFHVFICGVFHSIILAFCPTGVGTLSGGSIFDETLQFHLRYLRASIISAFAAVSIYAIVQTLYDTCTIVGVIVFGQDPTQWPPAFDAPWRATSLSDLWGRRWHQFFRRIFLIQGGYPLLFLFGRMGFIIGAFLSSGALHYITLVSLNAQLEPWRLLVGFGMMAPGILIERAFKQFTGRRVGGVVGWIWTMAWLLLWGNLIVDACVRAGMYEIFRVSESVVPGQEVVRRLVMNFDAWLHAM